MKITDFRTFVVGNPPPRFGGRYFLFVRLETDTGIVGYGEIYAATFSAHTMAAMAADTAERHLIGHDPFHVEQLWRRVYGTGYALRPDISLLGVLSGEGWRTPTAFMVPAAFEKNKKPGRREYLRARINDSGQAEVLAEANHRLYGRGLVTQGDPGEGLEIDYRAAPGARRPVYGSPRGR